jgi:hypothetical protein
VFVWFVFITMSFVPCVLFWFFYQSDGSSVVMWQSKNRRILGSTPPSGCCNVRLNNYLWLVDMRVSTRDITISEICGTNEMWSWWAVELLRCGPDKMWNWRDVELAWCGAVELVRSAAERACGIRVMWSWWAVAALLRCEPDKMWSWRDVELAWYGGGELWSWRDVEL